jgi:hypothetical protein
VSHPSNVATPDPEQDPEWPPADSCGEFLPAPDLLYTSSEVQGCGSTVIVMGGDARTLEYRATAHDDGSTLVDYRARPNVDIARDYGGGLDASGTGYDLYARDGLTVTYSREGPSILVAVDAVEAQAFSVEGFPALFYFESGTVTEKVVFTARDSNAVTVKSAEFTENTAAGVQRVCYLLDPSGAGG